MDWIYFGQITNHSILINLDSRFLNISLEYKNRVHEKIFYFLYQSQGGFTHTDIYTMPIQLRDKYFSILDTIIEEHNSKIKK